MGDALMALGESIVLSGDTMLLSFTLDGDEVRESELTEPHISISSVSSCSVLVPETCAGQHTAGRSCVGNGQMEP